MTLTKEEAVRLVYSNSSIQPTKEEYTTGGIRAELLSQGNHLAEHGDNERANRFDTTMRQLDKDFGLGEEELTALVTGSVRSTGRLVTPRAFLVGYTTANMQGMLEYLRYTGQEGFRDTLNEAARDGVEPAEALVSFYAKLCYKSLVVGENANISQVRDVKGNIAGAQKQAHGSIFEHISLNWVVTDCSRVYTHEQVRHRVGAAYSQTSGRYCRLSPGTLKFVFDPILKGCEDIVNNTLAYIEEQIYIIECRKGLRKPPFGASPALIKPAMWFTGHGKEAYEGHQKKLQEILGDALPEELRKPEAAGTVEFKRALMWIPTGKSDGVDFDFKKKLTSAARRLAPNGQTNEMGMTLNVRTLRHTILLRTARFAEWEIRQVYADIYRQAKAKWPLMFADAQERIIDGCVEVYGMKMNPYERQLTDFEDNELWGELHRRGVVEAELTPVKPSEYADKMAQATGGDVVELSKGSSELDSAEAADHQRQTEKFSPPPEQPDAKD